MKYLFLCYQLNDLTRVKKSYKLRVKIVLVKIMVESGYKYKED